MPKSLEERVTELEERVTALTNALEGQVQAQPKVINNCTVMDIDKLAERLSQYVEKRKD